MRSRQVTIVLGGSQGDIQPFLYLARGLVELGHSVRLCTHSMYKELVDQSGSEFRPLATGDPREIARDDYASRKRWRAAAIVTRLLSPGQPSSEYLACMENECAGADVLLCNAVVGFATHVGEKWKIPTGLVLFAPFYPTRSFGAPVGPQNVKLPGPVNLLSHLLLQEMSWMPNASWINRWRVQKLGLHPIRRWYPPLPSQFRRFFAFSSLLLPTIADWPENNHITGFWFGPPPAFKPPADLESFLANKDTIAVCFGSVLDERVGAVAGEVVRAGIELGFRVVVIGGWGIEKLERVADVYFQPFVPYSWLFPRIRMVVHAAGCGTSAEVLRAGVPSVTIPFAGEQKFWARRIWESGAGAFPLNWKRANKNEVKAALISARDSRAMLQNAQKLGSQLRNEDGVRQTIELLTRA